MSKIITGRPPLIMFDDIMEAPKDPEEVYSPHTQIIELPNKREEERKQGLAPSIITREGHAVGKSEEYKRSAHNDFAYASELRAKKFSGVRDNQMAQMRELWVDGEMVGAISYTRMALQPGAWEDFYAEYFGLKDVKQLGNEGI